MYIVDRKIEPLPSPKNNTRSVLLSCLQKSVRRHEIDLALNCMKELDLDRSLFDINDRTLWTKLKVYSVEDIGPACYGLASYINNKEAEYKSATDLWVKRSILLSTVNNLCRQNKSRIVDNVVHAYFKKKQPEIKTLTNIRQSFSDAIKEKNTDDSLKYAAHLYKLGELKYILTTLENNQTDKTEFDQILQQFKEARKITIDRHDLLFLVSLILHTVMKYQTPKTKDIKDLSIDAVKEIYTRPRIANFPDWVYDKHTDEGKRMGRKMKHFYEVAAVLVNCHIPDPYEAIAKANNTEDE